MSFKTVIQKPVPEGVTAKIGFSVSDEDKVVIPLVDLTTITLTLYEVPGGAIINNRDHMDVKNLNGGTFHATSGAFTFVLTPADNAIINNNLLTELHIALFECTYSAGAKSGKHEVHFRIQNLTKVS